MFYPDRNNYPYSAVVYLFVKFSDGSEYRGSGAIVGPNDILTAAHMVYEPGSTLIDMDIFPAYNGTASAEFPSFTSGEWVANYYEVGTPGSNLLTLEEAAHDLAIIGISERIGDSTGWFGMRSYAVGGSYEVAGYPSGQGFNLTSDAGYLAQSEIFDISSIYITPGSSGGPIFDSNNRVVGVVSTQTWGARIDSEWDDINSWALSNDHLIDYITVISKLKPIKQISDFESGVDEIHLEDSVFKGLLGNGPLNKKSFAANDDGAASRAQAQVIYDTDDGHLLYDSDGTGNRKAVHFATLEGAPHLSRSDFDFI